MDQNNTNNANRKSRAEDLTGQVFNRLTVISRAENRNGRPYWNCLCECGKEKIVSARDLKAGKVKSCGCYRKEAAKKRIIDLTGKQFGRLTVLHPTAERDRKGSVYWKCKCECGKEITLTEDNLVSGAYKSCGCLKKENQQQIYKQLKHVNGTCIEFLEKRKSRCDNKSGFRGVFRMPNGKYRVSIGFQGKRYHIGTYHTLEEAIKKRIFVEQKVHGEFLAKYHEWEEKAIQDPKWANDHPFRETAFSHIVN